MRYFKLAYYRRKLEKLLEIYYPLYYRWLYCEKIYQYSTGKKLNWKNPNDINQKLFWLARYWQNPLIVDLSDKIKVREYLKNLSLEYILTPLYNMYDSVDEIDFEKLPNQFVLKLNHGSAMNIIVKDKMKINYQEVKDKLNDWYNIDYGLDIGEFHYSKIEKKIVCEKFLESGDSKSLIDYKLHCFNGEPVFFLICSDRKSDINKVSLTSYDLEWNRLYYLNNEEDNFLEFEKPLKINEMIMIARILSKPFPYVRVDLYYVDNKIFFSELTFTPAANIMHYYKQTTLDMMGNMLILPKHKITNNW